MKQLKKIVTKPVRYCEKHKIHYKKGEECPKCKEEREATKTTIVLGPDVMKKLLAIMKRKGFKTKEEAIKETIMRY